MATEFEKLKSTLKSRYKNGPDNIGRDFVGPCLRNAYLYRRGTGFFSSGAMIAYADALDHLIGERSKIEIICSPVVHDRTLLSVLSGNLTEAQRHETIRKLTTNIFLVALGYKCNTGRRDYKRDLLAYFIAKEIIKIKFAVPLEFESIKTEAEISGNLYHVKTGYFKFPDESIVAFDGSFNESDAGHQYHIDQTQVWRSWVEEDRRRLEDIVIDVDADWSGSNPYIKTFEMGEEALELAHRLSPRSRPRREDYSDKAGGASQTVITGLRDYQEEALQCWKNAKYRGILAMATGTGKTRVAIEAIKRFRQRVNNGLVVVTVPYQALAHQWIEELSKSDINSISVFQSNAIWLSRVQNFILGHRNGTNVSNKTPVFVCVNKTFCEDTFQGLLKHAGDSSGNRLIVVDECHHFNKTTVIKRLPPNFTYRLGLSATPYESEEERHLKEYLGDIVFTFDVGRAIEKGYLAPYTYHPIFIELSHAEAEKYIDVSNRIRTKLSEADSASAEPEVMIGELDALLESVVAKLVKLDEILKKEGRQPLSLFYCGIGSIKFADGEKVRQLSSLARMLEGLHWRVAKITADENSNEREQILRDFRAKGIDAIASIRVLDEGIDIPDCRKAYILASQRSERQGIQRRGRILRMSPGKDQAELYDFIITGPHVSNEALEALYSKELRRAKLFAQDAINRDECLKEIATI